MTAGVIEPLLQLRTSRKTCLRAMTMDVQKLCCGHVRLSPIPTEAEPGLRRWWSSLGQAERYGWLMTAVSATTPESRSRPAAVYVTSTGRVAPPTRTGRACRSSMAGSSPSPFIRGDAASAVLEQVRIGVQRHRSTEMHPGSTSTILLHEVDQRLHAEKPRTPSDCVEAQTSSLLNRTPTASPIVINVESAARVSFCVHH